MKNIEQKPILLFDMDGVLVEIGTEDFQTHKNKQGFFLNKPPIAGAIESFKLLSSYFNCQIVSTPVWSNVHCWSEKRIWVGQHLGEHATKRLTLTHNKQLFIGDYLIDDMFRHGVDEFTGEHIHFGSEKFPDWNIVVQYLLGKI
jgi:5'-nucleotidase